MKRVKLNEVCEIIAGQSPPSSTYNIEGIGLPFFQGKVDFGQVYPKVRIWCSKPQKIAEPGDILISVRAPVGPTNVCNIKSCIGRGLSAIRVGEQIQGEFLLFYLRANENKIASLGRGSTFKAITQNDLRQMRIPLPTLEEQKLIVENFKDLDSLRNKRKDALHLLNGYINSIFLEMFGDPMVNSKNWKMIPLIDICHRLSDGPFGSKLKSSHYVENGVRVIRLQNIGINKFIDKDKAYISEEYYKQELFRYTCKPGEIIIATLGDPNLRACLIPDYVKVAINKADCVHCVPKTQLVNSIYLVNLLNHPQFQYAFSNLVHGQTRGRISSGQLKTVKIPVPNIELQNEFARILQETEKINRRMLEQSEELDHQFQALMQVAFRQ